MKTSEDCWNFTLDIILNIPLALMRVCQYKCNLCIHHIYSHQNEHSSKCSHFIHTDIIPIMSGVTVGLCLQKSHTSSVKNPSNRLTIVVLSLNGNWHDSTYYHACCSSFSQVPPIIDNLTPRPPPPCVSLPLKVPWRYPCPVLRLISVQYHVHCHDETYV